MEHIKRLNATLQLAAPYYSGTCAVDLEVLLDQNGIVRAYIDIVDNDLLWTFLGHLSDERATYRLRLEGDSVRLPLRVNDLDISLGRMRVDAYDDVPGMIAAAIEQLERERADEESDNYDRAEYDRDLSEYA